ncbi:hypothetical protein FCN18_35815 [Prauserella endophytica]|uniref:Uncharacterized protein n=1 Tax=Prauserella endophytica TaxID=1592324 RepID=A0ABY2RTS2_9PSEU|nr:hypothetical protein FCN18_35815 [Prauserella endophytica]
MAMFFKESFDFADRNSKLFDFTHTASAALWNLRWQVQGYVTVSPEATKQRGPHRIRCGDPAGRRR